jgi:hypothetical protein
MSFAEELAPRRAIDAPAISLEMQPAKALTWHGKNDIRSDSLPDPKIEDGHRLERLASLVKKGIVVQFKEESVRNEKC